MKTYRQIIALFPIYYEGKSCTEVVFSDSTACIMPYKASTVLKQVARQRGIHLGYLRENLRGKHVFNQPLPLDDKHIFIPIKCRRHTIGRDEAYGYLNCICENDFLLDPYNKQMTLIKIEEIRVLLYHSYSILCDRIEDALSLAPNTH